MPQLKNRESGFVKYEKFVKCALHILKRVRGLTRTRQTCYIPLRALAR